MNSQTNFAIIELFRTALRLRDIEDALESGVDFEDALSATIDYVNFLNDKDVIIAISDMLDDLQKWVSDNHV